METYKLYCIRQIKDPRHTDISFEVGDELTLYEETNYIEAINNFRYYSLINNDEADIFHAKRDFYQELFELTYFKKEDYFCSLAEYRDRQINEILND